MMLHPARPNHPSPNKQRRIIMQASSRHHPHSPFSLSFLLVSLFLLLPLLFHHHHHHHQVAAQYAVNSFLFNQTLGEGVDLLTAQLQDHPDLETLFYPNKYVLPIDFYIYEPPNRDTEYTQNVIFDPCRGYEYNCCFDTYGTPEYLDVNSNASTTTYGTRRFLYDHGGEMRFEISRRPEDELFVDESCEGENLPLGRTDCVMVRIARRSYPLTPRCWNYNASVIADASCRSPGNGERLPLCLELGVTQTAFIVECGGIFASNSHCGTYLEIHRPARTDKLSEVRLRAMYPSGYRMTVISTTYKGNENRTLCYDPLKRGAYEIWWVMRTFYNFKVERRIPFQVTSPECDWDGKNNRFLPYATLNNDDGSRRATTLAGLDPFDPARLLFTRPRVEGTTSIVGKGMGSTLVPIAEDTYHPTAKWDSETWHNMYTYTYTPDKPFFTVKRGVIEPSFEEQAARARLVKLRGYRRRLLERKEEGEGEGEEGEEDVDEEKEGEEEDGVQVVVEEGDDDGEKEYIKASISMERSGKTKQKKTTKTITNVGTGEEEEEEAAKTGASVIIADNRRVWEEKEGDEEEEENTQDDDEKEETWGGGGGGGRGAGN